MLPLGTCRLGTLSLPLGTLSAGTLTIFCGRDALHRVETVGGPRERLMAVLSYSETPGVVFTAEEQRGFYGRSLDSKSMSKSVFKAPSS